jgi:hypothetical protein
MERNGTTLPLPYLNEAKFGDKPAVSEYGREFNHTEENQLVSELNVYVDETGEHIMAFNKRFPQKEEFVY